MLRLWGCKRCRGAQEFNRLEQAWICLQCGEVFEDGYVSIVALAQRMGTTEERVRGQMRMLGVPERRDGIKEETACLLAKPRYPAGARRGQKRTISHG